MVLRFRNENEENFTSVIMRYRKNITQLIARKGDRSITLNTVYFIRKERDILVEHVDLITADLERVGYEVSYSYD